MIGPSSPCMAAEGVWPNQDNRPEGGWIDFFWLGVQGSAGLRGLGFRVGIQTSNSFRVYRQVFRGRASTV